MNPNADGGGGRCPYAERPTSEEGAQAWDLMLKASGQLRLGGMGGAVGIDMCVALKMAEALGYDTRAAAELIPAAERGMVAALNKRNDDDGE